MIRIHNLDFFYPGPIQALRGIDLEIAPGARLAIVGGNGSGKTTLARCLNGLHQPAAGRVLVDGFATDEPEGLVEVRRRIGMVFQNPDDQLVSTTVESEIAFGLENLAIPWEEMHHRVDEMLSAFRLDAYRLHPPHRLSGGERQRVAIAAAVAMRPRYLVLDEPTALLDPRSRLQVGELLEALRDEFGIATVHITQIPEEAARAERLVVLHRGALLRQGAPGEIFADEQLLRETGLGAPFAAALSARLRGFVPGAISLEVEALVDTLIPHLGAPPPQPEPQPEPQTGPAKLETEDLSYAYDPGLPSQHQGICGIGLQVARGSILALIGPSGSGKTTLAQHFNALLKAQRGRVLLDGVDIWSLELPRVRQRVGLVFQFPESQLFAESVEEDVAFGPRNLGYAPERVASLVARALELVGLPAEHFGARQPLSLSGGEKRRVALAGILAMDPEVLVLDEPTAGLDPRGAGQMSALFRRLQEEGRTLVLITHDMDLVARLADRIAVLGQGRLQLQGPCRQVLSHPDFAARSGLEPPAPVRLARALDERGRPVPLPPLTLEEAAALLGEWLAGPSPRRENP